MGVGVFVFVHVRRATVDIGKNVLAVCFVGDPQCAAISAGLCDELESVVPAGQGRQAAGDDQGKLVGHTRARSGLGQQRSFDHFVGAGLQRCGNAYALRTGGLQVEDKLEPCRL